MPYAMQSITDLYTNGLATIIDPTMAGALFVLFFIGIIFLRNLPTTAKVAIGLPALFIGFALISPDFIVLFTLGISMLFVFALWKMFGNR